MTNKKYPKTLGAQVQHLNTTKRVVFNNIDKTEAEDYLYRYNYINLITPFKYNFCAKSQDDINKPKKINGKHVYEKDTDFQEYLNMYHIERQDYPKLYQAISNFETHFKSIVSYEIFVTYNIVDEQSFVNFFDEMILNCQMFPGREESMTKDFLKIKGDAWKISNFYNYFDRLSLKAYSNIFHCLDFKIRGRVFDALKKYKQNLGVPSMNQFLERLFALVSIRNCIMHANSLTILVRYLRTETNDLRTSSDKRKFIKLIDYLKNQSTL